jgi:hypothetical protein
MYRYDFALPGDVSLRMRLPYPVFAHSQTRLLAGAYLPGMRILLHQPEGQADVTITYRDAPDNTLKVYGRHIVMSRAWVENAALLDLLNLAYGAARRRWLAKGLYPVHSACVGDSSYALVVGHSGAGKTSVALRLANSANRLVFSANKTLVSIDAQGVMQAVAGTRTITTTAANADRHLNAAARVNYEGRTAFLLPQPMYAPEAPARIALVCLVRLNDGSDNCARLSSVSALHTLYPFFLDTVYADTLTCDGNGILSGDAPRGCKQRLTAALNRSLAGVPVYNITGSMGHVTHALKERLCQN